MADPREPLLDAITELIPTLLAALEALRHAGRYLHPSEVGQRAAEIAPAQVPLILALKRFLDQEWPPGLADFRQAVQVSAESTLAGLRDYGAAVDASNPLLAAYRALGQRWRALEALYPVAAMLPPVSRFFLNDGGRADLGLAAALAGPGRDGTGVMHAANALDERGGFSLYVPEYPQAHQRPLPLVVALHGGSGHGRAFLWTWLRDARSRGCLLIAPTSQQDTWSLMGPDLDGPNLTAIVDYVAERWPVDRSRILLTGMSDGATFCWVAGLSDGSPFTHLAPVSGTFHPLLLEGASATRLAGLPVYLVHGARDWMFAADVARLARDALVAAGAAVVYREIEDLSHTYPEEENTRIFDWLLGPR